MKIPNLKNLDYKQLGIDHGEKVVIALIGLMIVSVLYYSNWKATDKSPTEMKERAEKTKKEFEERPWDEQREKRLAGLGQGNELAQKVSMLLSPVSATGFSIEPLNPPLHPDKTLISTPRWLPVQHMIADASVAQISMRPGTPPLEEGVFIRKPPKEKETKGKRRERMRQQRDAKEAKQEKKEETDDNIPEDLKPKGQVGGQAGGFGGGMGVGMGGARMGRGRTADKRGSKRKGSEDEPEMPKRQVALKPAGRGYHFVAVRGIFPLRDQTAELARAQGVPSTEKGLQGQVQFRDFKLERQTRIDRPGVDEWTKWEPVDRDAAIQLLENEVDGYAPETVLDGLIDGHIAMPYPERVVGQWDRFATHPDIKEFTLSDDEVQQQIEYELKLLDRAKKEEQQGKPSTDTGGFMGISRNMRQLNLRAQAASVGDEPSIREKILAEIKAGTGDPDKMNEQLEEFVRTRATPVDHYLLFRYLDIKVEPGKTYRYRVKLVVANPFKERRIEEVTDPSIIEGDTRETEPSEPTAPVTVQDNSQFYVKRVDWRPGRPSLPSAGMDVFQWFAETGTVVNKELSVQLGQILGGRKQADVLRPVESVFDSESVLFSSRDALVDVAPGFSFDPNLHKDILDDLKSVPSIKRTGASSPEEAVVVDDNGELHMLDGMDQKAEYDKTKTHYEQQNKAFDALRKSPGSDEDDVFGKHKHRAGNKKDRNDPRRDSFGRKGKSGSGGKGGGG
jgi:hypothetical protein